MATDNRSFFDKWNTKTSFIAIVLYIAYAFTHRANLPTGISYVLLALAVLYVILVLYLLGYAIRYRQVVGTSQNNFMLLGFRLLVSLVLLYLVAGSIWGF